jgi:hypothetical protein
MSIIKLTNTLEQFLVNCINFWVFPQRLFYIGRRFGTLCQVHPQRLEVCLQAFEDGRDRGFRNVGQYKTDAGETPKS